MNPIHDVTTQAVRSTMLRWSVGAALVGLLPAAGAVAVSLALGGCAASTDGVDGADDGADESAVAATEDALTDANCKDNMCAYKPRLLSSGKVQGLLTINRAATETHNVCLQRSGFGLPASMGCKTVSAQGGVKNYYLVSGTKTVTYTYWTEMEGLGGLGFVPIVSSDSVRLTSNTAFPFQCRHRVEGGTWHDC